MRLLKPWLSSPYSGTFHSGGTGPGRPRNRPRARMFIRSRRRAPISASAAIGSSTHSAVSRLSQNPLVRTSSVTSNQASQHSSVASTMRQPITSWRCLQAAQAVTANMMSRPTSKPTQAPRQPPVW